MDGKKFSSPINADIVKKYYAWGIQVKKKQFKEKTRKGGLNQKKEKKGIKSKTWKGSLTKKGFLDWKPEWEV